MAVRLLLLIIFLFTACQSGVIPCPTIKTVRLKRHHKPFREFQESFTAKRNEAENLHSKSNKTSDGRAIQNVTVEEWDCPKPGTKKYMPKTVKHNIRKNLKRINSSKSTARDSLGANAKPRIIR